MKCTAAYLFLAAFFIFHLQAQAQTGRPDMTFGNVLPENFLSADSNARAIFLFDQGRVTFDNSIRNSFGIVYERHSRILLLHKTAFPLATLTLTINRKGNEVLEDFKGATYNLENGTVVASNLDKSNIFKDRNTNFDLEKAAFPNVKEGSIIEYSYRLLYPGIGFLPPWIFQSAYPELWSEYDVTVPRLFDYAVKMQGYEKFVEDTVIAYNDNVPGLSYGVSDRSFYANQSIRHIWAQQNVPPLEKAEPYTTTLKNHLSRIEFQLSAARQNGFTNTYSTTWPQLTHELLNNPNFGASLNDRNRWMDDELKKVTTDAPSPETAIRRIYDYVRDNFTCTKLERIYLSQPLKKTWEEKKGTVSDINLLLTAIYRRQGLEASPVILSTRTNGFTNDNYPILNEYNYVITRVLANGKDYLLDASKSYIGFGQLPELCFNGPSRAIDSTHDRILLSPDSMKESRRTYVLLTNSDSGYVGRYTRTAGVFESMSLRSQLKKTRPEDFFESLRKSTADFKGMGGYGFDSLEDPEARVTWFYDMRYRFTQKRFYFNPILHERFNISPFSTPERHYPVEMPYCIDNSYVLSMEVPNGYAVEQLPQSQRFVLEDGSGFFDYKISLDGHTINFRLLLSLKKAVYPLDQYEGLRNFFSLIADKEKEPIIFKKIN